MRLACVPSFFGLHKIVVQGRPKSTTAATSFSRVLRSNSVTDRDGAIAARSSSQPAGADAGRMRGTTRSPTTRYTIPAGSPCKESRLVSIDGGTGPRTAGTCCSSPHWERRGSGGHAGPTSSGPHSRTISDSPSPTILRKRLDHSIDGWQDVAFHWHSSGITYVVFLN